jgi:hypothetical protein
MWLISNELPQLWRGKRPSGRKWRIISFSVVMGILRGVWRCCEWQMENGSSFIPHHSISANRSLTTLFPISAYAFMRNFIQLNFVTIIYCLMSQCKWINRLKATNATLANWTNNIETSNIQSKEIHWWNSSSSSQTPVSIEIDSSANTTNAHSETNMMKCRSQYFFKFSFLDCTIEYEILTPLCLVCDLYWIKRNQITLVLNMFYSSSGFSASDWRTHLYSIYIGIDVCFEKLSRYFDWFFVCIYTRQILTIIN